MKLGLAVVRPGPRFGVAKVRILSIAATSRGSES